MIWSNWYNCHAKDEPSLRKTVFLSMLKKFYYSVIVLLFASLGVVAQDFNLQTVTPSSIMQPGQVEIKLFNNLYTQQAYFDDSSNKQNIDFRESYFTSTNYFLVGVNSWLNLGAEVWLNSVKRTTDPTQKRTELAYLAPKFKIAPFSSIERFSITSTFLIPLANDMQGGGDPNEPFLAYDNFIWINQLFYDKQLGLKWQAFFELSGWMYLKKSSVEESDSFFRMPAKAIVSFFPNYRFTLYGMAELMTQLNGDGVEAYYFQSGPGLKYQLLPGKAELEGLYTKFLAGKNQGAGSTFNLGLRIIL